MFETLEHVAVCQFAGDIPLVLLGAFVVIKVSVHVFSFQIVDRTLFCPHHTFRGKEKHRQLHLYWGSSLPILVKEGECLFCRNQIFFQRQCNRLVARFFPQFLQNGRDVVLGSAGRKAQSLGNGIVTQPFDKA